MYFCDLENSYIIPGSVEHGARAGRSATRVLDVFSPVREEYKYWSCLPGR
jgi:hypothetical protein